MNIFFIRIDNFLKNVDNSLITKEFKSQKRCVEYSAARFLINYTAKNFYNIKDTKIVVNNKKPQFEIPSLQFSISHSKNIAAAAFDEFDIGFDIEEMKTRDIQRLSEYFKRDFEDEKDFYRYWTAYEAEYKSKKQSVISFEFENYMCSVCCKNSDEFNLYEIFPSCGPQNVQNSFKMCYYNIVSK